MTSNANYKSLKALAKIPRMTTGFTNGSTPLSPGVGSLPLEEFLGLRRQVETLGLPQILPLPLTNFSQLQSCSYFGFPNFFFFFLVTRLLAKKLEVH